MKALIFNQTGKPQEVLSLAEIEKPVPANDEVLVRMLASPIHPADSFFIQGTYRFKPVFPQVAGLEGAGIIEAAGRDVNLVAGTLVAFDARNSWAEYVNVPARSVIPLPPGFPIEKASQFYLNPFTAWGLLDESMVKEGDWLLLTAANSTVSKIAIQLAHIRNIRIIAVVRNLQQSDELKALGATEVLKLDDEFINKVKEITSGKGVNAALDAVGGPTGTNVLQCMAAGGTVVIYGLLSKDPVRFHNSTIIYKNLCLKGFGVRGYLQSQDALQKEEMITFLIEAIKKQSFQLPVAGTFALDQFKEALKAEAETGRKGKILFSTASI